jgi:hypothetical protein
MWSLEESTVWIITADMWQDLGVNLVAFGQVYMAGFDSEDGHIVDEHYGE